MTEPTTERLAKALEVANAPAEMTLSINQEALGWLTNCSAGDLNFASQLGRSNLATVTEALRIAEQTPEGNKGRIKALQRRLKQLKQLQESEPVKDAHAPTSAPQRITHRGKVYTVGEEVEDRNTGDRVTITGFADTNVAWVRNGEASPYSLGMGHLRKTRTQQPATRIQEQAVLSHGSDPRAFIRDGDLGGLGDPIAELAEAIDDDPRTKPGACVRIPSGDRAYVEGFDKDGRVLISYEAKALGTDSYPLHMLRLVQPSPDEVDQSQIDQSQIDQSQIDQSQIDQSQIDQSQIDQSQIDQSQIDQSQIDQSQIAIVQSPIDGELLPSPTEHLSQLEAEIETGSQLRAEGERRIWMAVATIREQELWKLHVDSQGNPVFKSFPDYCKQRWGWERSQSHAIAQTGEVVLQLKQSGVPDNLLPDAVSQGAELASLEPEQRLQVIDLALESQGRLSAKAIREAREQYLAEDHQSIVADDSYDFESVPHTTCWNHAFGKWRRGTAIARNAKLTRIRWEDGRESDIPTNNVVWVDPEAPEAGERTQLELPVDTNTGTNTQRVDSDDDAWRSAQFYLKNLTTRFGAQRIAEFVLSIEG